MAWCTTSLEDKHLMMTNMSIFMGLLKDLLGGSRTNTVVALHSPSKKKQQQETPAHIVVALESSITSQVTRKFMHLFMFRDLEMSCSAMLQKYYLD